MEWVGCVEEGERAFIPPHRPAHIQKLCIKTGMNSPGIGQEPSGTFQNLSRPGLPGFVNLCVCPSSRPPPCRNQIAGAIDELCGDG